MIFLKIILFPISLIYGCVTAVRNFCYSKGLFKSYEITGKSIIIGNLSMGGTGKSPHTLFLWSLLKDKNDISILSRGYGRTTKGLLEVTTVHDSTQVGDEPLMFKKRVGEESLVVVAEERKIGVDFIRSKKPNSIILLDDAFQHRKVKAGFSILLTDFNKPYFSDCVVPSGTLREWKNGKQRANCIVVTKCPNELDSNTKLVYKQKLGFDSGKIFFSQIVYGDLIPFGATIPTFSKILLVTGIANPKPLEQHLKRFYEVESLVFSDHHQFTKEDLQKIHSKFDTFTLDQAIIVTTEKDFVRLDTLLSHVEKKQYPWYYQSITVKIDEQETFNTLINSYVDTI